MKAPLAAILAILIAILVLPQSAAQRQRTTITGTLRPDIAAQQDDTHETPTYSTLITDTASTTINSIVRLSGYDKPVNASRETLHVSNLTDSLTILELELLITYLDKQHRELHQRCVTLQHTVLPLHTQLVTFLTWDPQRSFYYILSPKPRRQATPYDITTDIISVTYTR